MVDPTSDRVSRAPPYLGTTSTSSIHFAYGDFTLSVRLSQNLSAINWFSLNLSVLRRCSPLTPFKGFGSSNFARHYFRNHCLFSFPQPTKMIQFGWFPSNYSMCSSNCNTTWLVLGCPIRRFLDQSLLSAPQDLSQSSTSFFGIDCQGIHYQCPYVPFYALTYSAIEVRLLKRCKSIYFFHRCPNC